MTALSGRVALVTGGARGIGRAIAELLVSRNARVVIADNGAAIDGASAEPELAETVAAELGESCLAFARDIAAPGSAAAAVKLALARFGALDIVVNNAAILRDGFVFKLQPDDWNAVIDVNLSAAFRLLAAATPVMREQAKQGRPPGSIVNITSSTGLYGNIGTAAYASSKAALFGLTRVVAMELQRSGVNCNAVVPFAATRVTESIPAATATLAQYKERARRVPAHYCAQLVAYLCSPQAKAITGQMFGVRGREIMLFSQPRPVMRSVLAAEAAFTDDLDRSMQTFAPQFTDLSTDLEAFNTEPNI